MGTTSLEDFSPAVGEIFPVLLDDGSAVDLVLLEATATGDPRPFSLLFHGPADQPLDQRTWVVTHPTTGESFALFVVPIGRTDEGFRYEAVFN